MQKKIKGNFTNKMLINIFCIIAVAINISFAQSTEIGNPFNQYMSADAGVNLLSGTVSLNKTLASISSGGVQANLSMGYSGNVTQMVNNRNDVAPTGWLGLGWSLGFAKIISDNKGSMTLIDDSYYLQTAEGIQYNIVKDAAGKWWIANLPYWKIEPIVCKDVKFGNNIYDIIIGWKIVDDNGRNFIYGDLDEKSALQTGKVKRNATQYELCWPKTYGIVGVATGGDAYPYPKVWNLSKMDDQKGNYITFSYMQKTEKILRDGLFSAFGYTKECYLQRVESSDGGAIEFILKRKGEGVFKDEFIDVKGTNELNENDADAFVDPIERYYLSSVIIYNNDNSIASKIEFCYGSLSLSPNGKPDSRYVKRILNAVIYTNESGEETDRETYEYNTIANESSPEKNIPLGMMTSVQGSNCGKVEFNYTYVRPSNISDLKLHSQKIGLKKISSIGYLDNGIPYVAGFKNGYVAIYARIYGKWVSMFRFKNNDYLKESDDGSFIIGDKGWFIYVKRDGTDSYYTPILWNGKNWVAQKTYTDASSRDNITVGTGFILKSRIEHDKIKLTIPWSVWGGDKEIVVDSVRAEDGSFDRLKIYLLAGTNHVGIFYLGEDYGNNGKLRMYTFNHDKTKLSETLSKRDLDDDNKYILSGEFIYGAEESKSLYGHGAVIYQWNEDIGKWKKTDSWKLTGVQAEPSIEASGSSYFAVRHDDNDEMSLFYWNGIDWETPYKNKNMVSDDDLDFFYEAEWTGHSGNDFFLVREPLVKWHYANIPYYVPRFWGVKKKYVKIPYWSSTYHGALINRFELRDGLWSSTGAKNLDGTSNKTHLMSGIDWYAEKTSKKIYVWNGYNWSNESIKGINCGKENCRTLGENSFVVDDGDSSIIYFKKSDNFTKAYGVFLVTSKKILDPITDKVIEYKYNYKWNSDTTMTFDYVNNTPIISSYIVEFPNGAGSVEKTLCSTDEKNIGLGMGQICYEKSKNGAGILNSSKNIVYERFYGDMLSWPNKVYVDRVYSTETTSNKLRTKETILYATINGRPSSVKTFIDGKSTPIKERRIIYGAEKFDILKKANRLIEEAAVYECNGSCEKAKIVSGNASRYKTESGYGVISDVWSYEPKQLTSTFDFNFKSSSQNSNVWKRKSIYTKYRNNRAVESVDQLGIKASAIYENKLNGRLYANINNAGFNEVLLLPGTSCSIENWSNCNIVSLDCGYAVDLFNYQNGLRKNLKCENPSEENRYGRFSKKATLVNSNSTLKGLIIPEKRKDYYFSAWVQGLNNTGLASLYIDGNLAHQWNLLGNGKWEFIEWNGSLSASQHTISLQTDYQNSIRVQNFILIPSNASATLTYWNERWNKPSVSVDERGIASYTTFDNNGRIKELFGEDVSGNIVKVSERTYRNSDCRETTSGKNTLRTLLINDKVLYGINLGDTVRYIVPNFTDKIVAKWTTTQKGDKVRYQFYKKNGATRPNTWKTSCCGTTEGINESLDGGDDWILAIDVTPMGDGFDTQYLINIKKSSSGWVDYGKPFDVGFSPVFASGNNPNNIYYLSKKGITFAFFNGNVWTESKQFDDKYNSLLAVSNGSTSYELSFPQIRIEDSTSNTTPLLFSGTTYLSLKGNVGIENELSDMYRIAIDRNSVPYILYRQADHFAKDSSIGKVAYNLYVKKYEQGAFKLVGNKLKVEGGNNSLDGTPKILPNIVDDCDVKDADITIGPDGNLYVAYIGRLNAIDSGVPNPKIVRVKRLYAPGKIHSSIQSEVWAGPSQFIVDNNSIPELSGDMVELFLIDENGNTELFPISSVKRLKLVSGKNSLFLALLYQLDSESPHKNALTILKASWKNETITDESGKTYSKKTYRFSPLLDTSVRNPILGGSAKVEQQIVTYLKDEDIFKLAVFEDTPYILFANEQNENKLTVLKYNENNKRWLSVGRPAFAHVNNTIDGADIAFNRLGNPFVVQKENPRSENINRQNKIVPLKYVAEKDYDLTLLSLGSVEGTNLSTDFRQYILNYFQLVQDSIDTILLKPLPKTIGDICSISIENNNNPVFTWEVSTCKELNLFSRNNQSVKKSSQPFDIKVPLSPGMNNIQISVYGKDASRLDYTITINKTIIPDAAISLIYSGLKI